MKDFRSENLKFLDIKSASNFLSLVKDLKTKESSIVIGAGVSSSAGLPTWGTLLERISFTYFYHWLFDIIRKRNNASFDNPPSNVSMAFMRAYDLYQLEKEGLTLDFSNIMASNVEITVDGVKQNSSYIDKIVSNQTKFEQLKNEYMDDLLKKMQDYDPLLIAQMVKNQVREKDWNYLIRKSLYNQYDNEKIEIGTSKLMDELVSLVKNANIKSVVNFNYDDLLFHSLKRQTLEFDNVYEGCPKRSKNHKIYYPHGYIPILGGVTTDIVLSEEDYQKVGFRFDDWSNMIQSTIYNSSTSIFVGLSMTDPNLRRILKACSSSTSYSHYAFLPTQSDSTNSSQGMLESIVDVDLYRLGVKVIRFPLCNSGDRFKNLSQSIKLLQEYIAE